MADTKALKYKKRLFRDGQLVVTKKEQRVWPDPEGYPEDVPYWYETVPIGVPMVIVSEGTSKSVEPSMYTVTPETMRSIMVLYDDHGVQKVRKILINPLYGPEEILELLDLEPSAKEEK